MRIFHSLSALPTFKNAVVTIGSFDGIHQGHQELLSRINQLARERDGESIVVTFDPHPRQIIYPKDDSLELITNTNEKVALLEHYGIDNVVIVPFTIEFSQQSADEYIEQFLVRHFNPSCVVIGYDHRFGLNRQGNINYLKKYGQELGFQVEEIHKQTVDNLDISSTKIRNALKTGDLATANRLLGHPFPLSGKIVHGQEIGRKIGFPTANLDPKDKAKLIPADGVYAVRAHLGDLELDGMLYIGNRPTIKGHSNQTIEVNLFNFNQTIYGETLELELIEMLRGDVHFDSMEALTVQLTADRTAAKKALEHPLPSTKKKTV